ncbi:MAG: EamA family transporter RarD [Paracoccaceae bacterium]
MTATPDTAPSGDTAEGFAYALGAYVLWGFLPLYMHALANVPVAEVIAHRVIWSVPVALLVLLWRRRTGALASALRNPRWLAMAALTSVLLSANWGIYVWAVGSGHTVDAALGYYINPLFSVLLGALLLGERLDRLQMLAVGLAAAAVAVLTWEAGRVPFVALGLTVTWGFYAYLKRRLPIGPNQGFTLEVLLLSPLALFWVFRLALTGESHFLTGSLRDTLLLAGCGFVTAIPLMLYANGAKGLRLSTIGILQYTAPSLILVSAVFLLGEEFGSAEKLAFPMIWAALGLYSFAFLRQNRQRAAS